jgi:hypothetical protein
MPDLGIGEALAAFGGGDLLAGLFGGGEAATAGALGTGAADLGVMGTATDFLGQGTFDALAGGALSGTGADVASTAGSALAFPDLLGGAAAAGGFGAAADSALGTAASTGLASGTGSIASASSPIEALLSASPTAGFGTTAVGPSIFGTGGSAALPSNVANANAGASVFETGTSPITGTGTGFALGTAGAASVSAPSGVTGLTDATSAAAGQAGSGAANAAGTAAKSTSISDLISKAGSGAIDSLTKNPLPVALGAAGLGYNILQGQKNTANQSALAGDAATATANSNTMVAQGEALQQYLTSGTLPPQYMQQVTNAIGDAKTKAISNAAAQGLPTDPTKNTALAAELAQIDNQQPTMISQIASQLFSSGSGLVSAGQSAAGLSGQLYSALVQNDTTQAGNIGKPIATLASALNGKSNNTIGGTNIQLSAA